MNLNPFNLFKKKSVDAPALTPEEIRAGITQQLQRLMADPNLLERLDVNTSMPPEVQSEHLVNAEWINTYLNTEGMAIVSELQKNFETLDPSRAQTSLSKFLDPSNQVIIDAIHKIYPTYKNFVIEMAQRRDKAPKAAPEAEVGRIFEPLIKATFERIVEAASDYLRDTEKSKMFEGLNDLEIKGIIESFKFSIESDKSTVLPEALRSFLKSNPGLPKDNETLSRAAGPVIFMGTYETKLIDTAISLVDSQGKDMNTLKEEFKTKLGTLKDELQKKAGVDEDNIYYIKDGANVLFTPIGKQTFLKSWASQSDGSPQAVLNLFVGAVAKASPESEQAHDNQMDEANFRGLLGDMVTLSKAQKEGHQASFGTAAEPLLTFLINVAIGAHPDVQTFDVTRPGASGRDTSIQLAIDHMTARGLFPVIKPDLKSERWTLTINPGPVITATKLFVGSLSTDLKDFLMVLAARPNPDSAFQVALGGILKNIITSFDAYALKHLETLDIQSLANGYMGKIVDQVSKALDGVGGAPAGSAPARAQEPTAPVTKVPPPPPATAVAYSLRSILKTAKEAEAQGLVSEIMRRYHGIPVKEPVEAYITERNIPPFGVTVYEIEIEGAYLRNLPQVQLQDMNKVLTGEALGQYPEIKKGVRVVHSSFTYVSGRPAYIVVIAVGEPTPDADASQVKDPIVQKLLSSKNVEESLEDPNKVRELAQQVAAQGGLRHLDKDALRSKLEALENSSMQDGADKEAIGKQIQRLQKQIAQPDLQQDLGISTEEIYDKTPEELREVVQKYVSNFSKTNSYTVDYAGPRTVNRTPLQDKISADLASTIHALKDRTGLTRGEASLPPELQLAVLNTLSGVQKELSAAGVPALGAQDANQTMSNLTQAALSGDIKSMSYVHDQLKTYLSQLDNFLKERGGKTESPLIKKIMDQYVIPLAEKFTEQLGGPKDINRTMLLIGKLENYLDDLNAGTYKDQAVAPIAQQLEQIKQDYNIRPSADVSTMDLDQTAKEIFYSLFPDYESGDPEMAGELERTTPVEDKSRVIEQKINEGKPNKKRFNIQTLGKNFEKLRPLFEARAKEVQFDVADNDETLGLLAEQLPEAVKRGNAITISEGTIAPPKEKLDKTGPKPLSPEDQAKLQEMMKAREDRGAKDMAAKEEAMKGKQLDLKTIYDKVIAEDKAITTILQQAFQDISAKYTDVAERNQAVSTYRAMSSKVEQERTAIMEHVGASIARAPGTEDQTADAALSKDLQQLSRLKQWLLAQLGKPSAIL